MKKYLLILLTAAALQSFAQDTLTVMYYNLLNFPSSNVNRTDNYRTILQYTRPDVFVVNELESALGADYILDSSLNVFGNTQYQRAVFVDGYDTDNGLFYNATKVGLVSQLQLGTVLRDISVYKMYYKAPNLTAQSDTIYFWFFSCHLKAGASDYQQRNIEAQQVKFYLNSIKDVVENVFVGGDFNFYSGFESGCLTLQNAGDVPLIDPVGVTGNWSGDFSFAEYHTQSTRTSSIGGGAGGGMDDRFDIIFTSEDVFDNQNGVSFIGGSYQALGQDGLRFNGSITSPSNTVVPDSVAQALYFGSDHLPVVMKLALDETASLKSKPNQYYQLFFNPDQHELTITSSFNSCELILYDLMGKEVFHAVVDSKNVVIPSTLKGVFVYSALAEGNQFTGKIVVY